MIQQESLKKRLAKLTAPIFIETLLIMMLGAVDTIMLSRHSDNSVAAVGVVNQIIMLTFLVFEVINPVSWCETTQESSASSWRIHPRQPGGRYHGQPGTFFLRPSHLCLKAKKD